MARPLRIEYPGAWYHVMNRGRRREKIFYDETDRKRFLDIISKTVELFDVEIHAYVLMSNHYHLFIRTPKGNLSRSMRHLSGVYTQRFNKRHRIDGSLFRGRYKSILVEEETYMLELIRYIHRNPIKAGLEKKIGDYQWCSMRGYLNDNDREEWLSTSDVLRKFSRYTKEAKKGLKAFISQEVPKDILKRLESINWPAVMGGDEFKEKVKKYIRGEEINLKEMPEFKRNMLDKKKREAIVSKILAEKAKILQSKGSRKNILEKRAVIFILRHEFNLTLQEIALHAGGVGYAAISNQYKKAGEEVEGKKGCYGEVKRMTSKL